MSGGFATTRERLSPEMDVPGVPTMRSLNEDGKTTSYTFSVPSRAPLLNRIEEIQSYYMKDSQLITHTVMHHVQLLMPVLAVKEHKNSNGQEPLILAEMRCGTIYFGMEDSKSGKRMTFSSPIRCSSLDGYCIGIIHSPKDRDGPVTRAASPNADDDSKSELDTPTTPAAVLSFEDKVEDLRVLFCRLAVKGKEQSIVLRRLQDVHVEGPSVSSSHPDVPRLFSMLLDWVEGNKHRPRSKMFRIHGRTRMPSSAKPVGPDSSTSSRKHPAKPNAVHQARPPLFERDAFGSISSKPRDRVNDLNKQRSAFGVDDNDDLTRRDAYHRHHHHNNNNDYDNEGMSDLSLAHGITQPEEGGCYEDRSNNIRQRSSLSVKTGLRGPPSSSSPPSLNQTPLHAARFQSAFREPRSREEDFLRFSNQGRSREWDSFGSSSSNSRLTIIDQGQLPHSAPHAASIGQKRKLPSSDSPFDLAPVKSPSSSSSTGPTSRSAPVVEQPPSKRDRPNSPSGIDSVLTQTDSKDSSLSSSLFNPFFSQPTFAMLSPWPLNDASMNNNNINNLAKSYLEPRGPQYLPPSLSSYQNLPIPIPNYQLLPSLVPNGPPTLLVNNPYLPPMPAPSYMFNPRYPEPYHPLYPHLPAQHPSFQMQRVRPPQGSSIPPYLFSLPVGVEGIPPLVDQQGPQSMPPSLLDPLKPIPGNQSRPPMSSTSTIISAISGHTAASESQLSYFMPRHAQLPTSSSDAN